MQALIERAAHLGLLSTQRRTAFYKQLSARGWRKQEPASAELAPEAAQLAHQIGQALVDRGLAPDDIAILTGFSANADDNPFGTQPSRLRAVT